MEKISFEDLDKAPKIKLHLFRHGEQKIISGIPDEEYELTDEGREQAMKKSETFKDVNLSQSVAFGSPRKRSRQTAGFTMTTGILDSITGQESLDELMEKTNENVEVGSKISIDDRLNYKIDQNTPFGKRAFEVANSGKNYLKFLVEESDQLAKEKNDKISSTYSRQASGVAEIIKKYISIMHRWDELYKAGKYKSPNLERFLVSHGGVTESFLLKVIDKVKGRDERNRLVNMMNHFDYTEGFDVTISLLKPNSIHISYKRFDQDKYEDFIFDEDVPVSVVDEIITENS